MKAARWLAMAALIALPPQMASAGTISIAGSTTVMKYIRLAAARYANLHPRIRFDIRGGGSTVGVAQVAGKRADIGMLSRELTTGEKRELKGVRRLAIALDAIIPVVSREIWESGVRRISRRALAGIYGGDIRNWKRLGGPDRRIIVVDKNIYHGTRRVFAGFISGAGGMPRMPESVVMDADDDVLRLLRSSDQAIGYVGMGYPDPSVRALALVVDGREIPASPENIRNGAYPLARRLYLLVRKDAPDPVRGFIRFVMSPDGRELAERAGFLSTRRESRPAHAP